MCSYASGLPTSGGQDPSRGGVAYVEIYVEACGSLFEATAVAAKGTPTPHFVITSEC